MMHSNSHVWGIVLAGGEGKRLREFVRLQCNSESPKQYCAFTGTRSMLTHTIQRAEQIIAREQIVTIVNRDHLPFAGPQLSDRAPQNIIVQPANRDTGPGILYPLLHVHERDPEAIVVIFPSDHFVLNEEQFLGHVDKAVAFVENRPGSTVLLGVEPDRPEGEYGWIETGKKYPIENKDQENGHFYQVRHFVEKPDPLTARRIFQQQGLWNTMVLISHARVLVKLFEELTPFIYRTFAGIANVFNSHKEEAATEHVYRIMPSMNFSQAVLGKKPRGLVVLNMGKLHWSDWGNAARILSDLEWLTSRPSVDMTGSNTRFRAEFG